MFDGCVKSVDASRTIHASSLKIICECSVISSATVIRASLIANSNSNISDHHEETGAVKPR